MDPCQTLGEGYGEGRLSVSQSTVQVVALSIARVCRPDLRVLGRRLRLSLSITLPWDSQSVSRAICGFPPNVLSATEGIRSLLLVSHFGFAPTV